MSTGVDLAAYELIPIRDALPRSPESRIAELEAIDAKGRVRISGIRWADGTVSLVSWISTFEDRPSEAALRLAYALGSSWLEDGDVNGAPRQ